MASEDAEIDDETDAMLREDDSIDDILWYASVELAYGAVDKSDSVEAMISEELAAEARLKRLDMLADMESEACDELITENMA